MIAINTFNNEIIYNIATKIAQHIPPELNNNVQITGSSLGGAIVITFWSNGHKQKVIRENSKHFLRIMLNFTDDYNRQLIMDDNTIGCTINCWNCYKTSKIRGNKTPISADKAIVKINKFFNEHKEEFISYIIEEN